MLDRILSRNQTTVPTNLPRSTDLSRTDVFFVVKNRRRRLVLRLIEQQPRTRKELTHEVTLDEAGEAYTSAQRKCALVGLYQEHIPKLETLRIIEKDEESGLYCRGENFDAVMAVLDVTDPIFR